MSDLAKYLRGKLGKSASVFEGQVRQQTGAALYEACRLL